MTLSVQERADALEHCWQAAHSAIRDLHEHLDACAMTVAQRTRARELVQKVISTSSDYAAQMS